MSKSVRELWDRAAVLTLPIHRDVLLMRVGEAHKTNVFKLNDNVRELASVIQSLENIARGVKVEGGK